MNKKLSAALGVTLSTALLVVAVATPAIAAGTPQASSSVQSSTGSVYSGEALFEAIVFGTGPAVVEVTDLATPVEQAPEAVAAIAAIVDEIHAIEPAFFDRLESGLQSGNVKLVDSALQETSSVLAEALLSLGYLTETDIAAGPTCIQVVLFAVAALVVAGAGVLLVTAVSVTNVFWGPTAVDGSKSALRYEKLVAQIASAFA